MKVGLITQWYPPEPATIPGNLASDLAARGHEVRGLTGFPNYPDGRIYPGYRQRWRHVTDEAGVRLRRVPLYANHDTSGARRAINYLSYAASSTAAAVGYLRDVDVAYVYLSPATAFAAAAVLRGLRGIPVVVHIQDLWPESVTSSAMAPSGRVGQAVDGGLHRLMTGIYRRSAGIAVIAPTMRDLVIARGADPARTHTVLNWADEDLFHPREATAAARREIGHRGRCTIMYAGTMGPFQNLGNAIRAAAKVARHNVVDLVLAGSGIAEPEARRLAADLGADNVRFLGRRPMDEIGELYAAADFQLVSLRDLPIFHGTIPSKLQAALACAAPVVACLPGDGARLVETTGSGFACPPDDWRVLAETFLRAAKLPEDERRAMAYRAYETYQTRMSRQSGVEKLESILTDAAARGRRKR